MCTFFHDVLDMFHKHVHILIKHKRLWQTENNNTSLQLVQLKKFVETKSIMNGRHGKKTPTQKQSKLKINCYKDISIYLSFVAIQFFRTP